MLQGLFSDESSTDRRSPQQYGYDAFISYKHSVDGQLASALQQGLQRFAKNWYQRRAVRIFRDKTDLSLAPSLPEAIKTALHDSAYLIYLASPEAAASQWVHEELGFWIENRPKQNLLIVLTDGDIAWDVTTGDFDWPRTSALPRRLQGVFAEEPLYLDLRWARTTPQLSLRHPEFQDAIADLTSVLRQQSKANLIGEDVRLHRRAIRLAWSAATALFFLTITAAGMAVYARYQESVAEQQRDRAIARYLAAEAERLADRGEDDAAIERAAAFAIESWRSLPNAKAWRAARALVHMLPSTVIDHGESNTVWDIAFGDDGRLLATAGEDNVVRLVRTPDGGDVISPINHNDIVSTIALSADDRWLATGSADGRARLVDLANEETYTFTNRGEVLSVAFSPDSRLLATASRDGSASLIDTRTRSQVRGIEHDDQVWRLAFSPDNRWLATGTKNGVVRLIDTGTGQDVVDPIEHAGPVLSVAFSADGRWLATASGDGVARLIGTGTGHDVVEPIEHGGPVLSVAFSPDNRRLATGSTDGVVRLMDLEAGADLKTGAGTGEIAEIVPINLYSPVRSLNFSADDRLLATANHDGTAWLIDLETTRSVARVKHADSVAKVALSSNGRWLATASDDGKARLIDLSAEPGLLPINHASEVRSLAFSPDNRWLATASADGAVRLIDADSLTDTRSGTDVELIQHDAAGHECEDESASVAFSADGHWLAANLSDCTVRLINVASRKEDYKEEWVINHEAPVDFAFFSRERPWLVTGSRNGVVRLIDIRSRKTVPVSEHGEGFLALAFSADGRWLATGGGDGIARLIATDDQHEEESIEFPHTVRSVGVSPDGRYFAAGDAAGTVRLIDTKSREEFEEITHDGPVWSVSFSRVGQLLVTAGGDDRTVRLLDLRTGSVTTFDHPEGVLMARFDRKGQWLATAGKNDTARLFNIADHELITSIPHAGTVYGLAFSRDSRFLATWSADKTVRLIEVASGKRVAQINHGDAVWSVAFRPDTELLATASDDHTVQVTWADPQRMFNSLCEKAGRNLSLEEWEENIGAAESWERTCRNWRTVY